MPLPRRLIAETQAATATRGQEWNEAVARAQNAIYDARLQNKSADMLVDVNANKILVTIEGESVNFAPTQS